jgi:hypothetical protein
MIHDFAARALDVGEHQPDFAAAAIFRISD